MPFLPRASLVGGEGGGGAELVGGDGSLFAHRDKRLTVSNGFMSYLYTRLDFSLLPSSHRQPVIIMCHYD